MNKETQELLIALADKLGTTTEKLFSYYLKQASLEGTADIIVYSIAVVALVAAWSLSDKFSNEKDCMDITTDRTVYQAILLIVSLLLLLSLAKDFPLILAAFINPEYWVVQKIITQIK